jgi:hypothetical protein
VLQQQPTIIIFISSLIEGITQQQRFPVTRRQQLRNDVNCGHFNNSDKSSITAIANASDKYLCIAAPKNHITTASTLTPET